MLNCTALLSCHCPNFRRELAWRCECSVQENWGQCKVPCLRVLPVASRQLVGEAAHVSSSIFSHMRGCFQVCVCLSSFDSIADLSIVHPLLSLSAHLALQQYTTNPAALYDYIVPLPRVSRSLVSTVSQLHITQWICSSPCMPEPLSFFPSHVVTCCQCCLSILMPGRAFAKQYFGCHPSTGEKNLVLLPSKNSRCQIKRNTQYQTINSLK